MNPNLGPADSDIPPQIQREEWQVRYEHAPRFMHQSTRQAAVDGRQ